MCNLKLTIYIVIHAITLLATPLTGYSKELSPEETKDIHMMLSVDFAANYLDEMTQVQRVLVTKYLSYSDLIMATAGGGLNIRLTPWLESEAKLTNHKLDAATVFLTLSISTMKLGILAQQLGLKDAAGCHFKESRSLAIAAEGGEPIMANCRSSAYEGAESRALRTSTTKEAEAITTLVHKWVKLNMLYSKSLACTSGHCI